MEFEGKVVQIFPARGGVSKAGNAWTSQSVLFEVVSQFQYPRQIVVDFYNKEDEVKRLAEGTLYNVSIDISAREYNGRWYNDIRAWRVVPSQTAQQQPAAQPHVQPSAPVNSAATASPAGQYNGGGNVAEQEVDDLPF